MYDALENATEVTLDNTKPTIQRKYKNGANALVEATDTGSGLWKITESVGGNAIVTLSGTTQVAKFTLSSSSVTTVYVYDHAGNYETVTLTEETAKPTYTGLSYSQGKYTIKVTDAGAGLWKIANDSGTALSKGDYSSSNYPTTQQTFTGTGQ